MNINGTGHGFKSNNCIEYIGISNSPQPLGTTHITNYNALQGPPYNPTVVDYNSLQECIEENQPLQQRRDNQWEDDLQYADI